MKINKYRSVKEAVKASQLELNRKQIAEINSFQKNIDILNDTVNFCLIKLDQDYTEDVPEETPVYVIIDEYTYSMFGLDWLEKNSSTSLLIIYKTTLVNSRFFFGVSDVTNSRKSNKTINNTYLAIIDRCTFVNSDLKLFYCFNSNTKQTYFKMLNCTIVEGSDLMFTCDTDFAKSKFYLNNVSIENTKIDFKNKVKLVDSSLSYLHSNYESIGGHILSTIGDDSYSVNITKAFKRSTEIFICNDITEFKDCYKSSYDKYLCVVPNNKCKRIFIYTSKCDSEYTLDIEQDDNINLILKHLNARELEAYTNELIETDNLTKILTKILELPSKRPILKKK